MLQIFTVLFILYEVVKIAFADSFVSALRRSKELDINKGDSAKEIFTIQYIFMAIVEISYIIYVTILLFTSYWFIGLLILALTFIIKNRESKKMLFIDSVLSIAVLSLILVL